MSKWEYQVLEYVVKGGNVMTMKIVGDYLTKLNELGRDGWELTGIIPFTEPRGRLSKVHLILKKN